MASSPIIAWQIEGEKGESSDRFPLHGLQNHWGQWPQPWNQQTIASWQEGDDKPRQRVEKWRHHSANRSPYGQGYGLPSGHVWLWELDRKEGRTPKNWCLWTVVLKKTPESPLDSKESKTVNLKGDQSWIFTGRIDAETEAPVFWSSDVNRWLTGKVHDAGKDWGQKEKRVSEDEMAGWHHWCKEQELGQAPGDGEGWGGLACCSPRGHKELDMTRRLNNSNGLWGDRHQNLFHLPLSVWQREWKEIWRKGLGWFPLYWGNNLMELFLLWWLAAESLLHLTVL